jgi:hypothetical protein
MTKTRRRIVDVSLIVLESVVRRAKLHTIAKLAIREAFLTLEREANKVVENASQRWAECGF